MQKNIELFPPKNNILSGTVILPTSKSSSNRLLILQKIFEQNTKKIFELNNLSTADDTQILKKILENSEKLSVFDCGHGGTTIRFLTAYLAATTQKTVTITGSDRLKQRPIAILVDALRYLGANIEYLENEAYPPLRISPAVLDKHDTLTIDGSVSSQFVSAMLLIAPILPNGLTIRLDVQTLVSAPYLKMTFESLEKVGVFISKEQKKNENIAIHEFKIPPLTSLKNTGNHFSNHDENTINIDGDWSSATYFFSFLALANPKSSIFIPNIKRFTEQADENISQLTANLLEQSWENAILNIRPKKGLNFENNQIIANEIACDDFPDLVQTIAVLYAMKRIKMKFTGLQTLRIKETDRIAALQTELAKVGVLTISTPNSLEITAFHDDFDANNIFINTYNDHRMAMAFAPLALFFPGIKIENPDVVSKSFPNFWAELQKIGFYFHY